MAGAGLYVGKLKEGSYFGKLYERSDFILMDDQGDFFQLSKFDRNKLLLLIFTPDSIHPSAVRPMYEFSKGINNLKSLGIEVVLVSRTNREIVRNFIRASAFPGKFLVDMSGSVGRLAGLWELSATNDWGYALMDNHFQIFWKQKSPQILNWENLISEIQKKTKPK